MYSHGDIFPIVIYFLIFSVNVDDIDRILFDLHVALSQLLEAVRFSVLLNINSLI